MDTQAQHGYLVLADISGYTSFMAGTELTHAHAIIAEMLELIVARMTPMLTLSKLEGDAVFTYAPDARFSRGEALIELIESTYVAFRDHVESIRRHTTCQCNACRAVPTLELKFLVHHGEFVEQVVAGTHELVGSDVNLVHRLLKNNVSATTGCRAYALFSAASLESMRVPWDNMHQQVETYEHLGDVHVYCLDLHERYEALNQSRRIVVEPQDADIVFSCECSAPLAVVWDWVNDPGKRTQWMHGTNWSAGLRPSGRTGAGARNHCAHGKDSSIEVILDWHPFDYVTSEMCAANGHPEMRQTILFEPLDGGSRTRVVVRIHMAMPLPQAMRRAFAWFMLKKIVKYDTDFVALPKVISRLTEPAPQIAESHDAHLLSQPHS